MLILPDFQILPVLTHIGLNFEHILQIFFINLSNKRHYISKYRIPD